MNLSSSVSELPLVGPVYKKRLRNLGIKTVKDFLYHIPNKYNDFSHIEKISRVRVGDTLTVQGTLNYLKNQYTKSGKKIQIGEIEDSTGKLTTIWFNQPFLTRTLFTGTRLSLAGKIDWFGTKKALISPEYEILKKGGQTTHTGKIVAIYPETYGVSSKWIRSKIRIAYDTCGNQIKEYLPQNYGFVSLPEAIKSIHFPHTLRAATEARRRLAFDELFFLQKNNLQRKLDWQKNKAAYLLRIDRSLIQKFTDALPFTLTHSQDLVVNQILSDLQKTYPMNRLLGVDVGSGKTVVAAFAAFITFVNGFQTVIMAPTQILAQQHFNTLNN